MSRTRQFPQLRFIEDDRLSEEFLNGLRHTATYTISYDKGHGVPDHCHRHGHLIRPLTGSVRVNLSSDAWLLSAGQALWLRPQTPHALDVLAASLIQVVYVNRTYEEPRMPATGRIDVPSLLSGILDELNAPISEEPEPLDRLTSVMLDQVTHAHNKRWVAECPDDRRLAMIYQMLMRDPSKRPGLGELARGAGISVRTVGRLLREHCDMSFRQWRERIVLGLAANRLEHGSRVTDVALDLGYTSASAFIAAFRKFTGMTPKQWFQRSRKGQAGPPADGALQ